eukprot:2304594-Prorocentrum_lima.AAC.1
MPHGVLDVQGHCKSIVYWASRFLQRADAGMDLLCNVVWPLPPHLGTLPTLFRRRFLVGMWVTWTLSASVAQR